MNYTVRPIPSTLPNAGFVVTIRDSHSCRVLRQFPRVMSEAGGHKLAQLAIKGMSCGN